MSVSNKLTFLYCLSASRTDFYGNILKGKWRFNFKLRTLNPRIGNGCGPFGLFCQLKWKVPYLKMFIKLCSPIKVLNLVIPIAFLLEMFLNQIRTSQTSSSFSMTTEPALSTTANTITAHSSCRTFMVMLAKAWRKTKTWLVNNHNKFLTYFYADLLKRKLTLRTLFRFH